MATCVHFQYKISDERKIIVTFPCEMEKKTFLQKENLRKKKVKSKSFENFTQIEMVVMLYCHHHNTKLKLKNEAFKGNKSWYST